MVICDILVASTLRNAVSAECTICVLVITLMDVISNCMITRGISTEFVLLKVG